MTTLQRKDGWRSFKISKMKMSNGKFLGWCLTRSCIDVGTLIGSLYLEFRELLGLTQCECSYKRDNYKKKIREMSNAWKKIHRMKRFDVGSMTTPKYYGWRRLGKKIE
ncbi:hypothetical protein Goklo_015796 [Gossypium klotzschianum]|uniref:Uncharacterized protein n=3 Tax=Gossypium TaxID=3633 RepID=A0A7J8UBZ2_9ROSI|nr:hypothetical protein [Gossypium klotzschianum]